MQNEFRLPVSYIDKKMSLKDNIIEDLELIKLNTSNEGEREEYVDKDSVYGKLFNPENVMERLALVEMTKEYSHDKLFLKDTQKIIKKYSGAPKCSVDLDAVHKEWNEIKNTKNFKDYYIYYNWNLF